jgi:hypothetical protein
MKTTSQLSGLPLANPWARYGSTGNSCWISNSPRTCFDHRVIVFSGFKAVNL